MEHSSTVDGFVGTFWDESANLGEKAAPLHLNRSTSEWSFQEFLKESLAAPVKGRFQADHREDAKEEPTEVQNDEDLPPDEEDGESDHVRAAEPQLYPNSCSSSDHSPPLLGTEDQVPAPDNVGGIGLYSEDYERLLKQNLEMACAAVAMTWAKTRVEEANVGRGMTVKSKSHRKGASQPLKGKSSVDGGPPLPTRSVVMAGKSRPITSGSEVSEDEEHDHQNGKAAPGDTKRKKRMLSNRESARRSRRKKQAHLNELEMQAAQLRAENSTLVQRFQDINHKFQEAAVDNRVLKADCEALRAKVNMAARDLMARHGPIPGGQFILDPSLRCRMPYGMGGAAELGGRGVPLVRREHQEEISHGKMGRTPSMQRVSSLEHLQKRIRSGVSCNTPQWNNSWETEGPIMVEQHDT